jgi:hypothetical protein
MLPWCRSAYPRCISESLLGVGKTVALRAATSQLDLSAHHVIYAATLTRD